MQTRLDGPGVAVATPGQRASILISYAIHGVCTLPLIMFGTLAVSIREDLGFGTGAQGAIIAVTVLVAAAATATAARFVDRTRGPWALSIAGSLTAASLIGIAAAAQSVVTLAPFMAAAGAALGVAQPATDSRLHRSAPPHRQGSVFSLKQAIAGPGIGLVAGLAVPATAALGGWRNVFTIGAVLAGLAAATAAVRLRPDAPRREPDALAPDRPGTVAPGTVAGVPPGSILPARSLWWLGIAGAVATVPQAAFMGFAVSSATRSGLAESAAGVLFAVSCLAALAARLHLGRRVDQRQGSILGLVVTLLLASVGGFLCFGAGWEPAIIVGMPLLAATAWGWHGLFFLVVVRTSPGAPGRASGYAGSGVLIGTVTGPLLFGFGAEWSYSGSWFIAAAWSLAAACCMLAARKSIVAALSRR